MPNKVIIITIRQIYAPQMVSPNSMDTSYKCYNATILMHMQILKTTNSEHKHVTAFVNSVNWIIIIDNESCYLWQGRVFNPDVAAQ